MLKYVKSLKYLNSKKGAIKISDNADYQAPGYEIILTLAVPIAQELEQKKGEQKFISDFVKQQLVMTDQLKILKAFGKHNRFQIVTKVVATGVTEVSPIQDILAAIEVAKAAVAAEASATAGEG